MRDFNFFDELAGGRKKKTSSLTYVLSGVLLLMLALGSLSVYYVLQLRDLRDENLLLEEKANDANHLQAYNEVFEISNMISEAEKEKVELERIHGQLLYSSKINSILIKEISMAKPEAVALKSINFSNQGINIEGTSKNYDQIATFEYNLRGNGRFNGPFIPMIDQMDEGDYYSFTLSFTFNEPIEMEVEVEEEGDIANGQE